jgi:hypothetical protein
MKVRGHLDLREEPLGADDRAELGIEKLERDVAVMPDVAGEIDRCHSSGADLTLDSIPIGQSCTKVLDGLQVPPD